MWAICLDESYLFGISSLFITFANTSKVRTFSIIIFTYICVSTPWHACLLLFHWISASLIRLDDIPVILAYCKFMQVKLCNEEVRIISIVRADRIGRMGEEKNAAIAHVQVAMWNISKRIAVCWRLEIIMTSFRRSHNWNTIISFTTYSSHENTMEIVNDTTTTIDLYTQTWAHYYNSFFFRCCDSVKLDR